MKWVKNIFPQMYNYPLTPNVPRPGFKYTKYKICFSMIIVMCNNQNLSKRIHEKPKQH